jgi:integrase
VRWLVEYRLGGRESRVQHGGAFHTQREAQVRRNWIAGEIAAMRVPDLTRLPDAPQPKTLSEAMIEYAASRPDVGVSRQKTYRQARARLETLAERPVLEITDLELRAWVASLELAPKTVAEYLGAVKQALRFAGNVAATEQVRAPSALETETEPPSYESFRSLVAAVLPRHRPALLILEGTGLRIGELQRLRWGDLDLPGGRLRVARGRTKGRTAGRRFVPIVPWVIEALDDLQAPEGQHPEDLVLPVLSDQTLRGATARATKHAGLAHYHPHDLRHRFTSLLVLAGIPLPLVRQIVGHTRASITLDTYGHVLLDEPAWRLEALRRAVAQATGLLSETRSGAGPVPDRADDVSPAPGKPLQIRGG